MRCEIAKLFLGSPLGWIICRIGSHHGAEYMKCVELSINSEKSQKKALPLEAGALNLDSR